MANYVNTSLITKDHFLLQTGAIPEGVTASGAKYPVNFSDLTFDTGNNYSVVPIPYNAIERGATYTQGPEGDDETGNSYQIGFTFSFFGNEYSQFCISTNGNIQFTMSDPTPDVVPIPVPFSTLNNFIAVGWTDLVADNPDCIAIYTVGESPNRIAVIDFKYLKFYKDSDPPVLGQFAQCKLYETTNEIEIHLELSTDFADDNSNKLIGIQNEGSVGVAAPGRNATPFVTFYPEAWKFSPPKASRLKYDTIYKDFAIGISGNWQNIIKSGDPVQLMRGNIKSEYLVKRISYSPIDLHTTIYLSNRSDVVHLMDPFISSAGYNYPAQDSAISLQRRVESPNSYNNTLVKSFSTKIARGNSSDNFSLTATWSTDPTVKNSRLRWRSVPRNSSVSQLSFQMANGTGLYTEIPNIEIVSDSGRDAKIGALGRLTSAFGSIDISAGSGYTYANISFVSQGKTLAVSGLTYSISMGMISSISFTTSAQFREKPHIVITGDGEGASASVAFFQVNSYEIIQQGGNYLTTPQVVIDDTYLYSVTPSSITASLTLFNEGRIDYIRILDGGSGYGSASVSILPSPYGPSQDASAELEIVDGVITNIKVTNPGHGYVSPSVQINRIEGIGDPTSWVDAVAVANVDIYSEWVYEEPAGYNIFSKTIEGFKFNVPYEIEILASQDEYFRGFSRYSNNTSFQYYKI